MKQQMSFRFNTNTIVILRQLEKHLHASKTLVIEQALDFYSKKIRAHHPLSAYAGIISKDEGKKILDIIKRGRRIRK